DDRTMARQPPGGWLPGIDSEISPRRNRAYSPTARFMECVAFRTHPFQAQVSSVEQPCIMLTAAQAINDRAVVSRIISPYYLGITGVAAVNAASVAAQPDVASISIS